MIHFIWLTAKNKMSNSEWFWQEFTGGNQTDCIFQAVDGDQQYSPSPEGKEEEICIHFQVLRVCWQALVMRSLWKADIYMAGFPGLSIRQIQTFYPDFSPLYFK